MARVNITRQIKTLTGWKNVWLDHDGRGRIKWGTGAGRYILKWYEDAQRRRQAGGTTPAEALEAQRRKRLELDACESNERAKAKNAFSQASHAAKNFLSSESVYATGFFRKRGRRGTSFTGLSSLSLEKKLYRMTRYTGGSTTHEEAPPHDGCPLVFPSPNGKPNYRFLHDRCKAVAKRAELNPDHWYLQRFRDTTATRWLRAGIDVRTVQSWLGHESLETTQKYPEPSTDTERQLARIALPL